MELKAFKGMPHEFGGIDYTEDSEVEGGEFAVEIGKSGNEYIFDKNSSEGERLSKEYKKLDKNGRLTEDDPLALETFDQIAREEALKHAQRSVNEKGIDPFRNMYEQGGQAANGGVKYKDKYFWKGGAMPKQKPIYGYYADGGGKKKEDEAGDYGAVTNESTCVKGVNCFEDLAGVQGIPDSIYNNRAMREFFQSEEGKKLFEKTDNPQPGDIVQFNKANPAAAFKNLIKFYTSGNSNPSDLKYFEYLFDYPFHTGVIKDDKNYIGDGSLYEPVHSGLFDFSNLFTPSNDYYRYKNPESAKKVLEAAKQMEKNKTDILRKTFGDEKPVKYRNPEKYSSLYPYPSSTL